MSKQKQKSNVTCIYCDLQRQPSREHVLQDALGGVDVLTTVCGDCNQAMGGIDDMLAVKSPLSLLARRELNGAGPYSWDVDDARDGLLLEARQTLGTDSMTLLPQVIFDGSDRLFYCDEDDLSALGPNLLQHSFYSRLRSAYDHFTIYGPLARKKDHKNRDMLKLQEVGSIRRGYRFPPRICCRQAIRSFKKAVMFELRYHTDKDRVRALDALSKLNWGSWATALNLRLGAREPAVHFSFCLTEVLRALAKIGFNLLAFHCPVTAPSRVSFRRTVEWILEGRHAGEFGDVKQNGFIEPACVQSLDCPTQAHKFRLAHDPSTQTWKFYSAFFGGKAATYVSFSGPSREPWAMMDVIAPYDKHFRTAEYHDWYVPLETSVAMDAPKILPTIPWTDGELCVRHEPAES